MRTQSLPGHGFSLLACSLQLKLQNQGLLALSSQMWFGACIDGVWRAPAGELAAVPMSRLEAVCKEQDAKWLHRLSLGIDDEEVWRTE